MTGLKFLISLASIAVIGVAVTPRNWLKEFTWSARVPLAFGSGAVFVTAEMLVLSIMGVRWYAITLVGVPAALFGVRLLKRQSFEAPPGGALGRSIVPAMVASVLGMLLVTYAAATARVTSTDLLLYWGSKGQHYAKTRSLDFAFLATPDHLNLLTADYPPLVTCLDAWSALGLRRFPWRTALLTLPFFLALSALCYWSLSRRRLGDRAATEFTAVLVCLLGFGLMQSLTAGNAEPVLLFFETAALVLILFAVPGNRSCDWMTGVMLAGVVMSKIEGTTFAVLFIGLAAILCLRRGSRLASLYRLSLFPAVALAGWLAICARHGLIDRYGGVRGTTFQPRSLPIIAAAIIKSASYGAGYFPWVAVLILGLAHRKSGIRSVPLLLGAGLILATCAYYVRSSGDPTQWISWSASRVLLSPLLCFFMAVASSCGSAVARQGSVIS